MIEASITLMRKPVDRLCDALACCGDVRSGKLCVLCECGKMREADRPHAYRERGRMVYSVVRPICLKCTRTKTITAPGAKPGMAPIQLVRVERALVWRDSDGVRIRAWCHGDTWTRLVLDGADERTIETMNAFRGTDGKG